MSQTLQTVFSNAIETLFGKMAWTEWTDAAWALGVLLAAFLAGLLCYGLVFRALERWARRTDTVIDDAIAQHLKPPMRWTLPLAALWLVVPALSIPSGVQAFAHHALLVLVILCVAWVLLRALRVIETVADHHFDTRVVDNLRARAVHTQIRGFRNIASFAVAVLTVAFALMTFESVRQFGVSLLASAGVAGIIIGFAAQRSIATVVAGVQIAITQPIRVDDVVIVENEWGWVEEISLTYVVVRIWDLRRLVLPITYFIERPFQNWTRSSAEILGTVLIYADYGIDVQAVRDELHRIAEASPLWDKKVCGLQVTNATDRSLELRALVSASDSGKAWDLRCEVREKLLAFVQKTHPQCLPRVRAELKGPAPQAQGAAIPGLS